MYAKAFHRMLCLLVCTFSLSGLADDVKDAKAFLSDCGKTSKKGDSLSVRGKDGWFFLRSELQHLGAGTLCDEESAKAPAAGTSLNAIVDYKEQLKKHGIELILLPVPPKAVIYPDKISDKVVVKKGVAPPRLDIHHQAFYSLLKKRGVEVVDIVPLLLKRRVEAKGPLYCKTDSHWSPTACVVVAKALGDLLKKRPWYKNVTKQKTTASDETVSIRGDLLDGAEDLGSERLQSSQIRFGFDLYKPDEKSPVVMISDSHGLVFQSGDEMHAKGSGVAAQLSHNLSFATDLIGVMGSGVNASRISFFRRGRTAGYLTRKKVVIWCFAAREFTETTDWDKIPVSR